MLPASGTTRCFAVSADPVLYHQIVFALRLRLRLRRCRDRWIRPWLSYWSATLPRQYAPVACLDQVIIMIYQFSLLLTANLETYASTVHWSSPCFQAGNYHDTHTMEQSNTFER